MGDAEHTRSGEARPACDNCKARKTKCDRQSPCASCVTLKVPCRHSRRASEKRQRVLISSKYEDAVQDVSQQLADVKAMLQVLVARRDGGNGKQTDGMPDSGADAQALTVLDKAYHTPRGMIDEQVPSLADVHEGYNGDSSFQSHAYRIENALETLAASELLKLATPAPTLASETLSPLHAEQTQTTPSPNIFRLLAGGDMGSQPPSQPTDGLEFDNMPLPPMDLVLKLLRLAKTDKQRFFVDFQLFDETQFTSMCREVYFATEPIALWSWISCNVGLYFLFMGLDEGTSQRLGTTLEAVRGHVRILMTNAEAAMQSLRLCSEPSLELCRALALLATFYVKLGHSTVAWRLISGAARGALDLGLHRLAGDPDDQLPNRFAIFWYIFSWDKGLAMTCGRAPTIHHYDVTTRGPETVPDRADVPTKIYCAFIEFAIVTGDVQQHLFSATAYRATQQVRMQHVHNFASRLKDIQTSIASVNETDPTYNKHFHIIAVTIDILTHSLLAIVYRVLPPTTLPVHPLRCSEECVAAARRALESLVKIGETMMRVDLTRWNLLLNMILSLVPFVSFIILAGNAIATSSNADLALLSSVLSVFSSPAKTSQMAKKIHDACERFSQTATVIVSTVAENGTVNPAQTTHTAEQPCDNMGMSSTLSSQHVLPSNGDEQMYGFPMAQHDWDSVMMEYESELGSFDVRTLTNIIEPYIGNMEW